MGACISSHAKEDKVRSDAIDQEIERDRKRLRRECKILLLGSGESGKSTIVKQMKVIHQGGYSQAELASFRPTIYRNLLESAEAVVLAMRKLGLKPSLPANQESDLMGRIERWGKSMREERWFGGERGAKGALMWQEGEAEREDLRWQNGSKSRTRLQLDTWDEKPLPVIANGPRRETDRLDPEMAQIIYDLFTDPIFKVVVEEHASDFYLMDSGPYFMEHAKRIGALKYIPNTTDVLRARAKSVGIAETRFDMGPLSIHLFDVGGQRSERKKWIHCFEAVTSIIFCVALSEYDQVLLEASATNRLHESLVLFSSIVHSQWFVRTSVVLFLNKMDVFRKKIPKIPLSKYFPEYAGGPDVQKAAKFILWRFTQENRGKLSIYPHLTQATDTGKIKLVFAAIKETILSNSLKEAGVL